MWSPHSKSLLTALDVQNIQDPSGHTMLQPKELFPSAPSKPKDPRIDAYTYMTPMQKHLKTLQRDIELKENEMEKIKTEIDAINESNTYDEHDNRPHCSICHEIGHRRNRCAGQKCVASVSCGKIRLHKEELKQLDTLRANLKKLVKEKLSLDSDCEKITETINQNNKSFAQAVRGHLINSNKHKYLTTYADQVVPLTKIINIDLSILQKHYNNRVPDNLPEESGFFHGILQLHNEKVSKAGPSITSKLRESLATVERRLQVAPVSHFQENSSSCLTLPPHPSQGELALNRTPHSFNPPHTSATTGLPFERTTPNTHVIATASQLQSCDNGNVDKDVLDLSVQFDDLHSPPRKVPKFNTCNYNPPALRAQFDATSKQNPFGFPEDIHPQFPPWHQPDIKKTVNIHVTGRPLKHPYAETSVSTFVDPRTCTSSKSGSGESPPMPAPIDYSVVYDQFNVKPKTAFANRYMYSSEQPTPDAPLKEPELD